MNQLNQRFYSREELAQITGARLEDDRHFKRNVENALMKWGYGYDWTRGGATITYVPNTPQEKLKEILIRRFRLNIQVDMYAFACFITAFTDVPGFDCMPWKVREEEYQKYCGRFYTCRTMSNWARQLIERDIMRKGGIGSYWKTSINGSGGKERKSVTQEEAKGYFERRSQLLEHETMRILQENPQESFEAARTAAWKNVYELLWYEYGCCYYSCKVFEFCAWHEQGDIAEVFELTREISKKEERYA